MWREPLRTRERRRDAVSNSRAQSIKVATRIRFTLTVTFLLKSYKSYVLDK